jgi:negative regulator of replication initiation
VATIDTSRFEKTPRAVNMSLALFEKISAVVKPNSSFSETCVELLSKAVGYDLAYEKANSVDKRKKYATEAERKAAKLAKAEKQKQVNKLLSSSASKEEKQKAIDALRKFLEESAK